MVGGYKMDPDDPTPINQWGYTALVDVWDPARDAWRRLTPIGTAREYHAMPVRLPDGRILVAGGEGEPGNEPAMSRLEAFTPPYLLRGNATASLRPTLSLAFCVDADKNAICD